MYKLSIILVVVTLSGCYQNERYHMTDAEMEAYEKSYPCGPGWSPLLPALRHKDTPEGC